MERYYKANICFDCENACGGCSWTEYDLDKHGMKFELPEGAIAEPCYDAKGNLYTYHITGCPLFIQTPKRTNTGGMLYDDANEDFLRDPLEYLRKYGGL